MSEHIFYVPDYYPLFACKCGDCRKSCCRGWNISFTMQEYFRCIGMDCSKELRRRLDGAFHPADHPDPDRYAVITPNWRGECPLIGEDGLCLLQKECGEEAMSGVCRYYPRTPKSRFGYSCTLTGSCERVIELLYGRKEPIRMLALPLKWDIALPAPSDDMQLRETWQMLRKEAVLTLQKRELPLHERLAAISYQQTEATDAEIFCAFLCLANWLCTDSPSMGELWESCREELQLSRDRGEYTVQTTAQALRMCHERAAIFAQRYPDWEIFFEHLLINHLLDADYPFAEKPEEVRAKQEALNMTYAMLRFFAAMCADGSEESLVDVCAACFRMIEHSNFDDLIARMAARLEIAEGEILAMAKF